MTTIFEKREKVGDYTFKVSISYDSGVQNIGGIYQKARTYKLAIMRIEEARDMNGYRVETVCPYANCNGIYRLKLLGEKERKSKKLDEEMVEYGLMLAQEHFESL